MPEENQRHMPVSTKALIRRINRKLKANQEMLHKARGMRFRSDLGDYYITNFNRNLIVARFIDLEELAKELQVLEPGEYLQEEKKRYEDNSNYQSKGRRW